MGEGDIERQSEGKEKPREIEQMPGPVLVAISGPRGVGKGMLLNTLQQEFPELRKLVTYTTRLPRPGEVDGETYHFIDDVTFQKMLDSGEFVEVTQLGAHRYAPAKADVVPGGLFVADVVSSIARALKKQVSDMKGRTLMIALLAPERIRKSRISKRQGELSPENVQRMIDEDVQTEEIENYNDFHVIARNHGNEPSQPIRQVVEAVRTFLSQHTGD